MPARRKIQEAQPPVQREQQRKNFCMKNKQHTTEGRHTTATTEPVSREERRRPQAFCGDFLRAPMAPHCESLFRGAKPPNAAWLLKSTSHPVSKKQKRKPRAPNHCWDLGFWILTTEYMYIYIYVVAPPAPHPTVLYSSCRCQLY